MSATVDLLIVLHNSKKDLPRLFASLRLLSIPLTAYLLDNNSTDGTADAVVEEIAKLPFRAHFVRSIYNNGFARGVNLLARLGSAEFMFLLNPDARLKPGCLEALLEKAESDPRIGICEAKQTPREHPKFSDPKSGETSWCSGAAALIRRKAFESVEGFDEKLYFMYCEDVDFSWKLWLRNWKCVYVREAVVEHLTQDLRPGKRRTTENYFSFRNTLFLFYRFGAESQRGMLWKFLSRRFLSSAYPFTSKVLFGIALTEHIRYIPYLLQTRGIWASTTHPWIRFEETSMSR